MAYQYKGAPSAPVQSIEQARRANAELRRELERLAAENAQLGPSVETLRLQVTAARRKLTRQIRELEAVRIQAEHLANATTQASTLPEPIYGGRAGLEAATAEIEAHEAKGLKLGKPRRPLEISHGTGRKYEQGCRCGECTDYKAKKNERGRLNRKHRMELKAA